MTYLPRSIRVLLTLALLLLSGCASVQFSTPGGAVTVGSLTVDSLTADSLTADSLTVDSPSASLRTTPNGVVSTIGKAG